MFVFRIWIYFGGELSPSSRHSLPHGSVCSCVLGNVELNHGSALPAEHVWQSRGLVEQDIYFLGQKDHSLALSSGGKSWRTDFLPTLCDKVFLNEGIERFNVGHVGFFGLYEGLQGGFRARHRTGKMSQGAGVSALGTATAERASACGLVPSQLPLSMSISMSCTQEMPLWARKPCPCSAKASSSAMCWVQDVISSSSFTNSVQAHPESLLQASASPALLVRQRGMD